MTDLIELAERVERAPGPDRELDCLIAQHLGYQKLARGVTAAEIAHLYPGPFYTASLDAALKLATGTVLLHLSDIGADGLPLCRLGDPSTGREWTGIAATLPLAITAAALRARAAATTEGE